MVIKSRQFSRKELYDLVWSKPILTLAKEFGLSDRGLSKICERHSIPVPPRGYWAKKASGQKIKKPPLMILDVERDFNIRISATIQKMEEEPKVVPPEIQRLMDEEAAPKNLIKVPKTLAAPHQVIVLWLEKEREQIVNYRRWYDFPYEPRYNSPIQKRRLRILSTLFKELEKRGYQIKCEPNNLYDIKILAGPETMGFRLDEKINEFRIKLSEEEHLRSGRRWKQVKEPSGLLQFKIISTSYANKGDSWIDGADCPLEMQLNKIIVGFAITALQLKQTRLCREEAERKRWEEATLRREREKEEKKEKERQQRLVEHAEAWHKANQIRSYIHAVQQAAPATMTAKELAAWSEWALRYADQLDPITNNYFLETKPID